jgi:hypothetical protein
VINKGVICALECNKGLEDVHRCPRMCAEGLEDVHRCSRMCIGDISSIECEKGLRAGQ